MKTLVLEQTRLAKVNVKAQAIQIFIALLLFLLCIAYSLVLDHDVSHAQNLESVGYRVIAQYTFASLLMLLIWRASCKSDAWQSSAVWILLAGVLARLILVFVEPYTSNDVDRYLFDGRLAVESYDPYQVPHDDPRVALLREQWGPPPEHAQYVTLYPPVALALFSFAASFGVSWAFWVWKALTLSASLALLIVAFKVLKFEGKLEHLPLVALSPLLILEAGEGMHLDVFMALAVGLAVVFWQSRRIVAVGTIIAIGGLLKALPLVLLMPLFISLDRWRDRLSLVLSAMITCLLVYSFAHFLGYKPIGSIGVFFEKWRSGSPLFLILEPFFSTRLMLITAVSLALTAFIAIATVLWIQKQRDLDAQMNGFKQTPSREKNYFNSKLYMAMQLTMLVPLMVSPVVFPWYLAPLMFLVALRPNLLLLLLSVCFPLLYEVLNDFLYQGIWQPANWPVYFIGLCYLASAIIAMISIVIGRFRVQASI